jgi:carbamoyl-phosphate synthase small subunit
MSAGYLLLEDSTRFAGELCGAPVDGLGEVVFNTSMSGYQESVTDPSYAGQIINFTFPHIGNVGTNDEDIETINPASRGLIVREDITSPSNWRSQKHFNEWLKSYNLPGVCNVDTRALTRLIRDGGAPMRHRSRPRVRPPAVTSV